MVRTQPAVQVSDQPTRAASEEVGFAVSRIPTAAAMTCRPRSSVPSGTGRTSSTPAPSPSPAGQLDHQLVDGDLTRALEHLEADDVATELGDRPGRRSEHAGPVWHPQPDREPLRGRGAVVTVAITTLAGLA